MTGILTELQADPDQVKAVILGIGMNVNQDESDFPEELHGIATSIKMLTGEPVDRAQLIAKTLGFLEIYTESLCKTWFWANQAVMGRLLQYDWETNSGGYAQ